MTDQLMLPLVVRVWGTTPCKKRNIKSIQTTYLYRFEVSLVVF